MIRAQQTREESIRQWQKSFDEAKTDMTKAEELIRDSRTAADLVPEVKQMRDELIAAVEAAKTEEPVAEKKAVSEEQIKALEEKGFCRWTKGDYDRLYIKAWQLPIVSTEWSKSGKKSYRIGGYELSYSKSAQLGASKFYIDVKTGEVVTEIFRDVYGYEDEIRACIEAMIAG